MARVIVGLTSGKGKVKVLDTHDLDKQPSSLTALRTSHLGIEILLS
jgi:hypothetical protein